MPVESQWSSQERNEIKQAISKLLQKKAIQKCQSAEGQFISKIFLVPKSSGGYRLVLNLKKLNEFVTTEHFKIEDHKTVLKSITKDCYMATIDLTDAYYLIPVREEDRIFLRFFFEGVLYQFCVLPFGLSSAPYVFTKILKPLFAGLREEGLVSVVYLDDILLLGDSLQDCKMNVGQTVKLLEFLGFLINYKKSQLSPRKELTYLGFVYNSSDMSVALPEKKVIKLRNQISDWSKVVRCSIRSFAQFIGSLVSACPAMPYGWLYTKRFEREKFFALQTNHDNYDAFMSIPDYLKSDFDWWKENIELCKNPIRDFSFRMEIFSDASKSGWGIFCDGKSSHGFWNEDDLTHDINFLELRAAFYGLKCFASEARDCQILLRIDNTTAISYINRMGSIQFVELSDLARDIWKWCERRNIWLFASYIPSKENVEADAESRRLHPETEYELSADGYSRIVKVLGQPDIDLFASRANTKCSTFVSWRPDPEASSVDAFTISWKPFFFYAFPPFSIIHRVLQKIRAEKSRGIVVVPVWPAQPWWPQFKSLLSSELVYLNPHKKLLFSFNREPHPLWRDLTLAAGVCSAKN